MASVLVLPVMQMKKIATSSFSVITIKIRLPGRVCHVHDGQMVVYRIPSWLYITECWCIQNEIGKENEGSLYSMSQIKPSHVPVCQTLSHSVPCSLPYPLPAEG